MARRGVPRRPAGGRLLLSLSRGPAAALSLIIALTLKLASAPHVTCVCWRRTASGRPSGASGRWASVASAAALVEGPARPPRAMVLKFGARLCICVLLRREAQASEPASACVRASDRARASRGEVKRSEEPDSHRSGVSLSVSETSARATHFTVAAPRASVRAPARTRRPQSERSRASSLTPPTHRVHRFNLHASAPQRRRRPRHRIGTSARRRGTLLLRPRYPPVQARPGLAHGAGRHGHRPVAGPDRGRPGHPVGSRRVRAHVRRRFSPHPGGRPHHRPPYRRGGAVGHGHQQER